MFVVILGWFAALVASVVAIPQLVRILSTRSVAGVSLNAWRLNLTANLAWTLHGVQTGHANVIIPNAVFAVFSCIVLSQLIGARRLRAATVFIPSVIGGLLAAGVDLAFGPVAFAVVGGAAPALAWLLQLQELIIAPRIAGFSLPYAVLSVANQGVWLAWGLLVGEVAVILCAAVFAVLISANLGWAVLRRTGRVRARLAQMYA